MSRRHFRTARLASFGLLGFLAACGDPTSPEAPTSERWTRTEPVSVLVHSIAGRSFDDLYAIGGRTVLMAFDGETWTSVGPLWEGGGSFNSVWTDDAGTIVVASSRTGMLVRRDGAWQTLPALSRSVCYAEVAADGAVWTCGYDGLLARWDGAAWTEMPAAPAEETLVSLAVLDADDVVLETSLDYVLRWRDGAWESLPASGQVTGLCRDGTGTVLVSTRDRVLHLAGDELVPLDDHVFANQLRDLDVAADGTLVVAGWAGAAWSRRDGVWRDFSMASADDVSGFVKVLAMPGDEVVALDSYNVVYHRVGETWSRLPPLAPRLHAFATVSYG